MPGLLARFRSISTALIVTAALSACSGGSPAQSPVGSTAAAPAAMHLQPQTTTPPQVSSLSKSSMSMEGDGHPRWKFYDPLSIAKDGSFAVASWYTKCYPTSAFFGPWYLADANFTMQVTQIDLPSCTLYKGFGSWEGDALRPMAMQTTPPTPTPAATPTPGPNEESPDGLYIVKVDVSWSGLSVGAIAGPAIVSSDEWLFGTLVNPQSFKNGHLYEFYVAKYLDTTSPVPVAQ